MGFILAELFGPKQRAARFGISWALYPKIMRARTLQVSRELLFDIQPLIGEEKKCLNCTAASASASCRIGAAKHSVF
jgi:hypothetical protein